MEWQAPPIVFAPCAARLWFLKRDGTVTAHGKQNDYSMMKQHGSFGK